MVSDGRASAVTKIEPVAGFARLDLKVPKRLEHRRFTPDFAKRLLGYHAGAEVVLLEKGARIDASLGRNAAGQFAGTAHIQSE
jgi:hypothetical protein